MVAACMLSPHSPNKTGKLSQRLCHNYSNVNIIVVLLMRLQKNRPVMRNMHK